MQSPTEVIAEIETRYRIDILDVQLRYARTMAEHYPQNPRYARDLGLLTEAASVRELLIRAKANEVLGEQSPWYGDAEADACDQQAMHERYFELKLMTLYPVTTRRKSPSHRTGRAQRTRTQPAPRYRNDLTQRREVQGEREEHKQPMHAHWAGAEKMRQLMSRVEEAYAELGHQAESNTSKPAASAVGPERPQPSNPDQSVETTTGDPVAPLNEQSYPGESRHQGPIADPSMNSGRAAMGSNPARRLTPLQQAALTAIGNWLLVIGHCGSTKLTTDDIKGMAQARRPRPVQAVPRDTVRREVRRYSTLRSKAGPGGACFRTAA